MIRSLNRAFIMGVVSDGHAIRYETVDDLELCHFVVVVEIVDADRKPFYSFIPVDVGSPGYLREQGLQGGDEVLVDGQLVGDGDGVVLCATEPVRIGRRGVELPDWSAYDRQVTEP